MVRKRNVTKQFYSISIGLYRIKLNQIIEGKGLKKELEWYK